MNSKFSLAVFAAILLVCSFAHGQGATASAAPIAVNQLGVPIGSTLVTICTTNPGTGTCPTKVTLYTDNTLTTACSGSGALLNNLSAPSVGSGCSNPGFSDALGNVVAFSNAGAAWCQYSGATITTYTQPCFFGGSSGGVSGLTSGVIPQGGGLTGIENSSPQLDNGVTTLNQLTYGGQAIKVPSDGVHAAAVFLSGNTTPPPNLPSNSSGWIGPPSASLTSYFPQLPSTPPAPAQALLCDAPNGNISSCSFESSLLPTSSIYPVWGGSPVAVGAWTDSFNGGTGTHSNVNPTATTGTGDEYSATAVASTSTVLGYYAGQNGSNAQEGMLAFYRWAFKFQTNQLTNTRCWMGLAAYNSSSTRGSNNVEPTGTTRYASDTPNATTLGFLIDTGSFTHTQAEAILAGTSSPTSTVVDSGITPDTNIHVYEMTTNSTGTQVNYFIDGAPVASITTNLPVPSQGADSWGDLFWSCDNKNTATAISAIAYWTAISQK